MSARAVWLTGVVLASAVVYAGGCARTERAQPERTPKAPAAAAAVSAPAPAPSADLPAAPLDGNVRGWTVGKSYSYALKLTTKVDFQGAGSSFDFDIVGTLEIVPAVVAAGSGTLQARIRDARIVTRIPGSQAELDKLAAEIRGLGALFELQGGRTATLFVPNGMSQMAASTYRHVASALQFARASDGSNSYSAEEYDTTGKYLAEYSLGSTKNVWQKRKARYLGILGAEGLPADVQQRVVPELVSSRGEIQLSDDDRPLRVRMMDELTLTGAQIPLASSAAIELDALEPTAAGHVELGALLAQGTRYRADEPIRDAHAAEALDVAKAGGLDFDTIADRLERTARDKAKAKPSEPTDPLAPTAQVAKSEREVHDEARLFHALSAVFRNQPGATAKAVSRVRAGSPAADALVDGLGDAATPNAHLALAKILSIATVSSDVEDRVILSLARTPKPTKEASDALKAVLKKNPSSPGALYGLGTHARLYRDDGKTKDAAELGEFLAARFKPDDGPMTRVVLLRAIANSGYVGALPRVLPFLKDNDEEIRATAVRALQSMRDPRVDGVIAARMKDDESAEVRISAIDAAKVREPSEPIVSALIDAGTHGASPHVRYRAVELMADWLNKRPELRVTLDVIANNDPEDKIRERAKAAL